MFYEKKTQFVFSSAYQYKKSTFERIQITGKAEAKLELLKVIWNERLLLLSPFVFECSDASVEFSPTMTKF